MKSQLNLIAKKLLIMKKICKSCASKDLIDIKIFKQCMVSDGNIIKGPLSKAFCKSCGLGFGYNRYKLLNYSRTDGSSENEVKRHEQIAKGIYDIINNNNIRANLILEIGAGNFQTSHNLALLNKNFKVQALEPFPEKKNEFDNVYNIDCEFSSFETDLKYDVIFPNNVIEHIKDIKFFKKKASLLNENGLMIVCCPSSIKVSTELLFADHLWHITSLSIKTFCNQVNLYLNSDFVSNWDSLTHVYLIKKREKLKKEKKYFDEVINKKRISFYKKWTEADVNVSKQINQNFFIIFGAGEFTQLIKIYMPKTFKLAKFIIVNNDNGHRFFNKPIINIEKSNGCLKNAQILLGVKKSNRKKVAKFLIKSGVEEKNILETLI